MIINKVTFTGADDSVSVEKLAELIKEHPYIELGILVSRKSTGLVPRYPSLHWIDELLCVIPRQNLSPFLMRINMFLMLSRLTSSIFCTGCRNRTYSAFA